jgi:hypothetical protein
MLDGNIPVPPDFLNLMNGEISKDFIHELVTTFKLAAFISPLLLLCPKKYGDSYPSQHIIAVSATDFNFKCSLLHGVVSVCSGFGQ